jgi:ribonuclease HI
VVTEGKVLVNRLPDNASIFSAESQAILLALEIMSQSYNSNYLICSDSLSCIKSIENRDLKNPLILKILEHLNQNLSSGYTITFFWVPSHIGIVGNTAADASAMATLCLQVSDIHLPHTDFKTLVSSYTNSC